MDEFQADAEYSTSGRRTIYGAGLLASMLLMILFRVLFWFKVLWPAYMASISNDQLKVIWFCMAAKKHQEMLGVDILIRSDAMIFVLFLGLVHI
jgi:hypothetical protein